MSVDLFAGIPVSDLDRALDWYGRLLGSSPSFRPNDVEAVFDVNEHGWVYVELLPEHAGHARVTLFVADLEARVQAIAQRGLDPVQTETYENGVRKVTYRDPDGNEVGLGGGPAGG